MNRDEARELTQQIEHEPDWHAEGRPNTWTGQWSVTAWTGDPDPESGEQNSYMLRCRADWYRLRLGLQREAESASPPCRDSISCSQGRHGECTGYLSYYDDACECDCHCHEPAQPSDELPF